MHEILKVSHEKLRGLREEFQPQFNSTVVEARTNISAVLKAGPATAVRRIPRRQPPVSARARTAAAEKGPTAPVSVNALPAKKKSANPDSN